MKVTNSRVIRASPGVFVLEDMPKEPEHLAVVLTDGWPVLWFRAHNDAWLSRRRYQIHTHEPESGGTSQKAPDGAYVGHFMWVGGVHFVFDLGPVDDDA